MRLVIVESPYKGNIIQRWLNRRYARKCLRDCLMRGESPYASHLLYTQPGVLSDQDAEERKMGMEAGWAWRAKADAIVAYVDRGISEGMSKAIIDAGKEGRQVEIRSLTDNPTRVISP